MQFANSAIFVSDTYGFHYPNSTFFYLSLNEYTSQKSFVFTGLLPCISVPEDKKVNFGILYPQVLKFMSSLRFIIPL